MIKEYISFKILNAIYLFKGASESVISGNQRFLGALSLLASGQGSLVTDYDEL